MNGMDLGQIMCEFAYLMTGKGFTAFFDYDDWPKQLGEPTEDKLRYLAGEEIDRRMQTVKQSFLRLMDLALKSGAVGVSQGRIVFRPDQELTAEEEQALLEVSAELAKIDTFISNPVPG